MSAPTHDNLGGRIRLQHIGISENIKYAVGEAVTGRELGLYIGVHIEDIPEYREQVFSDARQYFAVYKRRIRRLL